MKDCESCEHFRRKLPPSMCSSIALAKVANGQLMQPQIEREIQDNATSAAVVTAQLEADPLDRYDQFPHRPINYDYCGLREAEGVYLIREVRNEHGDCGDWARRTTEKRTCASCLHRRMGPAYSAYLSQMRSTTNTSGPVVDRGEVTVKILDALKQQKDAGEFGDMSAALASPDFEYPGSWFHYCGKVQRNRKVLAGLWNRHAKCTEWKPSISFLVMKRVVYGLMVAFAVLVLLRLGANLFG